MPPSCTCLPSRRRPDKSYSEASFRNPYACRINPLARPSAHCFEPCPAARSGTRGLGSAEEQGRRLVSVPGRRVCHSCPSWPGVAQQRHQHLPMARCEAVDAGCGPECRRCSTRTPKGSAHVERMIGWPAGKTSIPGTPASGVNITELIM